MTPPLTMGATGVKATTDPEQRSGVIAERLIDIAHRTLEDLRQRRKHGLDLTLDSTLDGDLGLDSLARVELFARIERAFQVTLPQLVCAEAVTLQDISQALNTAAPLLPSRSSALPAARPRSVISAPPATLTTLNAVLAWHMAQHPEFVQLTLCDEVGEQTHMTYRELWQRAHAIAAGLQREGARAGAAIALMLPTSANYFSTFMGVLLAGAVPVPLYPPARPNQLEEHLRRHAKILRNCAAILLVTEPGLRRVASVLRLQAPDLRKIVTVADLSQSHNELTPATPATSDAALLQYTSGSTGQPKGVVLSHANLLANIRAMGAALRVVNTDVFVSWLPLYHDMGLIGAWLSTLYFGVPLIVMSPLTFLRRPLRWLETIQRCGGTLSAAPNFAYELCLKRISDEELATLDLRSWRLALNGAEAVMPDTLARFQARFAPCGLGACVLTPVYGLAECSVGLAVPQLDRGPRIDVIERERFVREGVAVPGDATLHPLRFVACGIPLPGHAVRILDAAGHEVGERVEGRLEFSGPSATAGYLHDTAATGRLIHGAWLDSGDRAYIADGEIFITGRSKDIIIRAGRNLYPEELESAVGEIDGVRKGCVAVFGSADTTQGTERVIVLVETLIEAPEQREALRQRILERAIDLLGEPPDEIVLVAPRTVLKTSSGKIRHAASRDLYASGKLEGRAPPAPWRQLLSLWLEAIGALARRGRRRCGELIYAAYFWGTFGVIVAGLVPLLVLPLSPATCWRWSRAAARRFIRWTRIPFTVVGGDALRGAQAVVIVANHASYLDGLFLLAMLSTPARFVAKRELAGLPVIGRFLERLGTHFVERFERLESVAGAQQLVVLAGQDKPCIVFPEGTFTRAPGLRPFHLGAFASALQADVAVVPIALRGTRSLLREGQWLPRRAAIAAHVGAPLAVPAAGDEFARTVTLRNAARRSILEHCGEPDLSA